MSNYFNGKGTVGFTCDVCGRETNGCNIANGMKFCAKCYQETFGKDNQEEEIRQLKQQLEEKGKEINIKNNKLAELKKELTICKDKLRRKTQSNRDLQHRVHNVNTQLAIQELERVKILLQNAVNYEGYTFVGIYDAVNNQIKELKGE